MGFFSSVSRVLGGGSDSQSSSQNRSGFALLPGSIQGAYTDYASGLRDLFDDGASDFRFDPMDQNIYEDRALDTILQGVTPTAESLSKDVNMLMNPFDDHVINTINREAQGDYSILKQGLNEAGQFGSNRQILGANDIEQTRLNTIGSFKQDQFNRALDNTLNELTQSRAADTGLQFGAGEFVRGLDLQEKQTPINAYRSFGELLGVLPTSGGSVGNSSSSSSSDEGIGDTIAGIAGAFSDKRLKTDIEKVGKKNGFNLYSFRFKGHATKFVGVMAQEVEKIMPEAVGERDGFLTVDYDKIGLELEAA